MSDHADVHARLYTIVRETFRVPADHKIDDTTASEDVAGWDSLSHSTLIINVEEAFGIELPLERVYDAANLGELADAIAETKGIGA